MKGRRLAQASSLLGENLHIIGQAGGGESERLGALDGQVATTEGVPVYVRMVPAGRVFGGTVDLELATATPVLPMTRGISARARGLLRMRGVSFHAARGDRLGQRIAASLGTDSALVQTLASTHFQQVRVAPDGRAVIRHVGGSLVWMLFPPVTRPVPLAAEQARATLAALDAFAAAATRMYAGHHTLDRWSRQQDL